MSDQPESPQPQGERRRGGGGYTQPPSRSTASFNWRTKDASPRVEPQPRRTGNVRNNSDAAAAEGTRLYVGNLLYSATKDDISAFFAEHGFKVTNLNMSVDPATGRNPSYCFVDLETAEDASKAMEELNGLDVLGRQVKINPGVARRGGEGGVGSPGQGTRGGFGNASPRGWGREGSGSGQQEYKPRTWNRDAPASPSPAAEATYQPKRLYIGNLPSLTSPEETITSLFSTIGIELVSVTKLIAPHESKQQEPGDHHYLFVDLNSTQDVEQAIQALDGQRPEWAESALRVSRAKEGARRREDGRERGSGFGSGRRAEGFSDWRKSGA